MTVSAAGLRQALDQLADLRSSPVTVEEALEQVVATADALFGVDGTALMLVDRDQALRNLAVSDARAALLEELQAEHGEGPCVDAFEDKQPVGADDLASDDRWPAFAPAAAAGGLLAVLASPIPYSDHAVGVVAVFAGEPHPWTEAEQEAIVAFTELVALLILNAMEACRARQAGGRAPVGIELAGGDRAGQGGAGRTPRAHHPPGLRAAAPTGQGPAPAPVRGRPGGGQRGRAPMTGGC